MGRKDGRERVIRWDEGQGLINQYMLLQTELTLRSMPRTVAAIHLGSGPRHTPCDRASFTMARSHGRPLVGLAYSKVASENLQRLDRGQPLSVARCLTSPPVEGRHRSIGTLGTRSRPGRVQGRYRFVWGKGGQRGLKGPALRRTWLSTLGTPSSLQGNLRPHTPTNPTIVRRGCPMSQRPTQDSIEVQGGAWLLRHTVRPLVEERVG